MKQLKHNFNFAVIIITGVFLFNLLSCDSKEKLHQSYNQGYFNGNKAGYDKGVAEGKKEGHKTGHDEGYESGRKTGYNNGYNAAKNEYQERIDELQNKITAMENIHKTELTASYNRGFQAGEISMENKIIALVDLSTQQKIRRNRRNEALFRLNN